jgi:anti-sigma-K factor RskA
MSTRIDGTRACLAVEPLLEDHVGGFLNARDALAVERHLAECASCRTSTQKAMEGSRLLKDLADLSAWQVAPAPGFARVTMARIRVSGAEQAAERDSFWQSFVFFGWRFATTAVLAVALLAVYDARWGRNLQPGVGDVRPMLVRDIVTSDSSGAAPASRDDVLVMVAGISDAGK